jgi:3-hydroxybutyrate dehydrogenase
MNQPLKRVLVTGGGSGIGLAIARSFENAGHDVLIAGRNEERLRGTGMPYVVMDVCDQRAIEEGLRQAGQIDIFVANPGGATTAPALKTSREVWDQTIALNLTSVFHCAQAAVPPMIKRGWGRFIVLGSTASLKGYRYASAYVAAKHGVLGFVRALALELAKTGVTANALCPGYTDTPMIAGAIDAIVQKTQRTRDEAATALTDANPMGRLVSPTEIANAALWLASEAAAAVNGQAIAIDGGETA